jgi:hypothetical protein
LPDIEGSIRCAGFRQPGSLSTVGGEYVIAEGIEDCLDVGFQASQQLIILRPINAGNSPGGFAKRPCLPILSEQEAHRQALDQ